MMHFPPLFQISPYFRKNFGLLREIVTILPFPEKFLDFHPPTFLMTFFFFSFFFSHRPQISNYPPIFAVSVHFPLLFRENVSFPLLFKIPPPVLGKFTCFLHTLRV